MTKHRYGMRLRKTGIASQPRGYTDFQKTKKKETGFHGILTYEKELEPYELRYYALNYLN